MRSSTKHPVQKELKIKLTILIEGEQGMGDFARMLRTLYDNGFQPTVRRLLRMLIVAAEKHGAKVPQEVRELLKEKETDG